MSINPNELDFPGNSIVPEPKKEIKRLAKGAVRRRKEPLLDRIFGGETAQGIVEYVLWEVLVPAAKSTLSDIVSNTIELALYGDTSRRSSRLKRDRDRTVVSYNSMYDKRPRRSEKRPSPRTRRDRHRFDDIVITARVDAEEVLSTLIDLVDQYDVATVGDFYDACRLTSEYTDRKYGWESLNEASIHPVRGGYIIDLPKPHPIE